MEGLVSQVATQVNAANDALAAFSDYLLATYPNDSGWTEYKDAVADALRPLMDTAVQPPNHQKRH